MADDEVMDLGLRLSRARCVGGSLKVEPCSKQQLTLLIPKAALLSVSCSCLSLDPLVSTLLPVCPLQRCCPLPHRLERSGAMGTGTLSSLLLLLLVVTDGDADMKGHFDPGEETESWVSEK